MMMEMAEIARARDVTETEIETETETEIERDTTRAAVGAAGAAIESETAGGDGASYTLSRVSKYIRIQQWYGHQVD